MSNLTLSQHRILSAIGTGNVTAHTIRDRAGLPVAKSAMVNVRTVLAGLIERGLVVAYQTTPAVTYRAVRIESASIQQDHEDDRPWRSDYVDECFACGRGLTRAAVGRAWFIHLATDGTIFPAAVEVDPADPLDQGWFPLGSGCAAQVDVAYRSRINARP